MGNKNRRHRQHQPPALTDFVEFTKITPDDIDVVVQMMEGLTFLASINSEIFNEWDINPDDDLFYHTYLRFCELQKKVKDRINEITREEAFSENIV